MIRNIAQLDHFYNTGNYKGVVNTICNSKYSIPKKVSLGFLQ